jgi:hypothetical protein
MGVATILDRPWASDEGRIAEKGYFMFRVNEDQTGGVELADPQTLFAEAG